MKNDSEVMVVLDVLGWSLGNVVLVSVVVMEVCNAKTTSPSEVRACIKRTHGWAISMVSVGHWMTLYDSAHHQNS